MSQRVDRYRPGVGIALISAAGRVWVGRRADLGGWQLPQGGIDPGESPRQACLRELVEEVGTDRAEILAESRAWWSYDLPPEVASRMWKGRYVGQRQRWFALRFLGRDDDVDVSAAGDRAEFDAWRWADWDELPGLIVEFKRAVYRNVVAEFRHLA